MQNQAVDWEKSRLQAIKATEEVLKSPCWLSIREVRNNEGLLVQISFETILEKLKSSQYQSRREWMEDCQKYLIAMQSKDIDHNIFVVFKYLFDKYKRLLRKYDVVTVIGWWKTIENYNFKLDNLLRSPPEGCKDYTPLIHSFPYNKKEFLTHKMVDYVAETGKKITNSVELMEIMSIIGEDHNALAYEGDVLKVELKNLHQATLQKLYTYVTTRYPQKPAE